MTATARRSGVFLLGAAMLAVAVGAGASTKPQIVFAAVIAVLGVAALAAPAGAWVICAVIAALTFKGLSALGVLPSVATFVDLPLSWGALFIALVKRRPKSRFLRRHMRWLAALALAVLLAFAFHRSQVLRPLVYLMLLGEPFAIVAALMADPPSPRVRLALERVVLGLVLVQIPIVFFELAKVGSQDHLQGTLYGAGAGAHVISAVLVVGAIYVLAGGAMRVPRVWRLLIAGVLLAIPFLADAKQVVVALPAVVLASSWRVGRAQFVLRAVLAAGSLAALLTLAPASSTAARYLRENANGHGGKQATALFLWHTMDADPSSVAFGMGPAETVSRAAFLTLPGASNSESAFNALGLTPAAIPLQAQAVATSADQGSTPNSSESGESSLLGVFGDLGVFGALTYAGLLLSLFLRLRHESSPEGVAAACGFALFIPLGLVFDWWEQPPFGVMLGVLAGLSLSALSGRASAVRA